MAESINHPDDNKISLLKNRVKILQDICDKIDPFQGISKEDRTILAQMGDFDYSNPYQLTNQLIVMMEDTLEELKRPMMPRGCCLKNNIDGEGPFLKVQ